MGAYPNEVTEIESAINKSMNHNMTITLECSLDDVENGLNECWDGLTQHYEIQDLNDGSAEAWGWSEENEDFENEWRLLIIYDTVQYEGADDCRHW